MSQPAILTDEPRSELIHSYIKIYPNKEKLIIYKTPYALPDGTGEIQAKKPNALHLRNLLTDDQKADEQLDRHLQRAKTIISDLVDCNPFDMFVTFTSNCKKCKQNCKNDPAVTGKKSGCVCDKTTCKRYDVDYQRRNMFDWLNHAKKVHGHFTHLMVMEYHKDGAIHFHALFYGYKGRLKEFKLDKKDGKMIYNLVEHRRGNTTAKLIPLDDKPLVASYIKKYITKDMPIFNGRKRYVCSTGLLRPIIKHNYENISAFLLNPEVTLWSPRTEPYKNKRTKRIEYPKATNVETIATIELDNTERYAFELSSLQSQEPPRLRHIARMALRARAHLNRMSSGARLGSLGEDCQRVPLSGARA